MMRIAGILTGAALAVALLIVTIGIPDFVSEPELTTTKPIILPLNRDSRARAETGDAVAQPPPVDSPAPVETEAERVMQADGPATGADDGSRDAAPAVAASAPVVAPGTAAETPIADLMPEDAAADPQRWYAFWSPFRSALAADGFVSQLQRVTGLDYRVVKVKAGVYEVAFAYTDDADIQTHLAQISAATGLELPEG